MDVTVLSGGVYVTIDIPADEVVMVTVGIEVEGLLEIGSTATMECFDFWCNYC